MKNRLYRSRSDRILAGVCGGVGEYLDTDPSLVRLGWVLLSVLGGSGVLLYILAWLIIPEAPRSTQQDDEPLQEPAPVKRQTVNPAQRKERMRTLGIILMVVGGVLLLDRLVYISLRQWWPLLLIGGGVALLLQGEHRRRTEEQPSSKQADEPTDKEEEKQPEDVTDPCDEDSNPE